MRNVDVKRIEFFMTKHCTGHCKHCSVDFLHHSSELVRKDRRWREKVIENLTSKYTIDSIMLFGGEPLLNSIAASDVLHKAKECGIPKRQMITNGYFSSRSDKIELVARRLLLSGLNHVIVSVDYFHQESIPLDHVIQLIEALKKYDCEMVEVQPCWIKDPSFDCYENKITHSIIERVKAMTDVPVLPGNIVALEGRAKEHLSKYFEDEQHFYDCADIPYMNRPDNVKNMRFMVDGSVTLCKSLVIGNIADEDVLSIIKRYETMSSPILDALSQGGVLALAKTLNTSVVPNPSMMSTCEYCYEVLKNVDLY